MYRFCLNLLFLLVFFTLFAPAQKIRVTILHVNDVYQFMPVKDERYGNRGGLARLITLKKKALKENKNVIFTLGGDTLSPSVESLTYKGAQMIDAWNAVGIDYAVFGNHEFDTTTADLLARMKESNFKWLGANVFDKNTNKIFADLPPYEIKEIGGVKIGFIGFLLPETQTTSRMEKHLEVKGFCKIAAEFVPKMRAAGANAVVGLTHLSMREDKELAQCAQFDLILGGHEHNLLQSSSAGTPIFKMSADARELGKFNLNFDAGTKRFETLDWEIIPVTPEIADAFEFGDVFEKYRKFLAELAIEVGETAVELDALSISNRTKETNIGNYIADMYRQTANADVALVNGGSIRADAIYKPGALAKRDVLWMVPFRNPIVKIEISGKILRAALEHGVSRSGVGEDSEPGRFPQISGMSFKFDSTQPAGKRTSDIMVGGKPLDENKTYTLATSDFLVTRSGDEYVMFKDAKVLISAAQAQRDSDVFEKAVKDAPDQTIAPIVEGRIVKIK
jgi:5'-nucleotidase